MQELPIEGGRLTHHRHARIVTIRPSCLEQFGVAIGEILAGANTQGRRCASTDSECLGSIIPSRRARKKSSVMAGLKIESKLSGSERQLFKNRGIRDTEITRRAFVHAGGGGFAGPTA